MPQAIRVIDRIVDQGDFSLLAALAAGDVLRYSGTDWRNYASSGATLPTSPVAGQLFLHTPTGRTNLMVFDGSAWRPLLSIGAWTVHVDGTNGTNNQNLGHGTGSNAFRTVQFAIDQIAPTFTGNIIINVAAGTYAESVNIRGKFPSGAVTITIRGTLSVTASITATGGTQGSGAAHGTVTFDSWGAWSNQWLQGKSGSNNNVYRVIDSISGSTATVVAYWNAAPVNGDTFDVVQPGTTVNRIDCSDAQTSVVIENIAFAYADSNNFGNIPSGVNASVTWVRCRQVFATGSNFSPGANANWVLEQCFFERTRILAANGSLVTIRGSKFLGPHTTGSGGRILHASMAASIIMVTRPSVVDGASNGCTGFMANGSAVNEANSHFTIIRNCAGGGTGRGLRAETTGVFTGTANFQYSGNDTNTSVDATTYGVIS